MDANGLHRVVSSDMQIDDEAKTLVSAPDRSLPIPCVAYASKNACDIHSPCSVSIEFTMSMIWAVENPAPM